MARSTPGPWRVKGHAIQGAIVSANGTHVASAHNNGANARLIACSPSMLALLEKALPIIEAEADQRAAGDVSIIDRRFYFTEMRDLAGEISAEIDKARGKGVSGG